MIFDKGVWDALAGGVIAGGFTVVALIVTVQSDRARAAQERVDKALDDVLESVQDVNAAMREDAGRIASSFRHLTRMHLLLTSRIPFDLGGGERDIEGLWKVLDNEMGSYLGERQRPGFDGSPIRPLLGVALDAYANAVTQLVRKPTRRSRWRLRRG